MNAKRDQNRITTLLAALNTDGITPINVCSDPTAHTLCTSDGNTGSDFSITEAPRDENRIPVALVVSSVDGKTPIMLYADLNNRLLIQST